MGGVHVLPVEVRWGHCDPAGIVYFPRFFDMFHEAMEAWFNQELSLPYTHVIGERLIGFPSVHTEADFGRVTKFGDSIAVELRVSKLGKSSIHFAYRIRGAEDEQDVRCTGTTVCVVMDLDSTHETFRRAIPMPQDLRERIEAFGVDVS